MEQSTPVKLLRDVAAILITAVFMFPIFWWALTSIKPQSAVFNKDQVVVFDFQPTAVNYYVTVLGVSKAEYAGNTGISQGGGGSGSYDSRQTILDSLIISLGATVVSVFTAVIAAYALSRMRFKGRDAFLNWIFGQRFMPPIAILIPLVTIYKFAGMRDTDNRFMGYVGLILIYALMNLPIAVLLLKSFFDDVPKDVDEAAMIDGATRWQTFRKIVFPMVRGGVAAAAVLCFIFSYTEFLLSLFLTTDIRTLPVKISTFVTSTGSEWGVYFRAGNSRNTSEFHFHFACSTPSGSWPYPWVSQGVSSLARKYDSKI